MTNAEILEKAIHKAIDNGLPMRHEKLKSFKYYKIEVDGYTEDSSVYGNIVQYSSGERRIEREWFSIEELIYNHEFAKALFGEKEVEYLGMKMPLSKAWEWHLQQMVVSDDPIRYLRDNL
jgi:hypothetical protein